MTVYDIYIENWCECGRKQKVASFDYFSNAVDRRKELINTFGRDRVLIQKRIIK